MQQPLLQVLSTLLVNSAITLMVGALAALTWLPRDAFATSHQVLKALRFMLTCAILACASGVVLSLWQTAATMADVALWKVDAPLLSMFFKTHYGQVGLVTLLLLAAAAVVHQALGRGRPSGPQVVALAACITLIAAARAASGHAMENGLFSAAVAIELAHIMAMALWSGAVIVSACVVLPLLSRDRRDRPPLIAYLVRLSQWATVALAVILATGAYNTYRVLATPGDLVASEYGWILLTKLGFVTVAIALGAWNRFVGFPVIMRTSGANVAHEFSLQPVLIVMQIESAALFFVLTTAALLTGGSPPAAA